MNKEQELKCPRCGETKTHKWGTRPFMGEKVQMRRCTACGYTSRWQKFTLEEQHIPEKQDTETPEYTFKNDLAKMKKAARPLADYIRIVCRSRVYGIYTYKLDQSEASAAGKIYQMQSVGINYPFMDEDLKLIKETPQEKIREITQGLIDEDIYFICPFDARTPRPAHTDCMRCRIVGETIRMLRKGKGNHER